MSMSSKASPSVRQASNSNLSKCSVSLEWRSSKASFQVETDWPSSQSARWYTPNSYRVCHPEPSPVSSRWCSRTP